MTFDITDAGKYVIQFKDATTSDGMHEFLLAECRLRLLEDKTGIESIEVADTNAETDATSPFVIYNAAGARIPELQPGVNIIRMADGTTRKVYVK